MDTAIGQSHVKLNGTALRIWAIARVLAANLILMWAACIASAQISEPQRPLLITLPPGIPSEKVHIDYVLGDRFGAHGDYARPIADANSYSIPTSVDGKPAESIQMVAWAPGCETRTFNVKLRERGDNELQFECTILPMVTLTGRIHPVDLIQGKLSEVSIWYLAEWKCTFFGWADCMVPQFEVATVKPDANGFFEVELPDFSSDPIAGDAKRWGGFTGEFRVVLRETKTWNPIASLQAELKDLRTPGGRLKIMPAYPSDVVFVGETPDQGDAAPREEPLQ
jgi:hypothetical protein